MDRLERIAQLKAEADEARENIRQRQEARERDPSAMHDYLMAQTQRSAPVQRDVGHAELLYRVTETAPTHIPAADGDAANAESWDNWDKWLKAHLTIERRGLIAALEQDVGEIAARLRTEREAGEAALRREITELRRDLTAREERAVAVAEVRKQYVGLERERLETELASRDTRIAALEQRLQMLCHFLSLSGLEPPHGVV
jgi:hypothetical protein